MLNRAALLQQLQAISESLFIDISDEFSCARASWQRIVADPTFVYKVRQISTPWLVPDWYDHIGTCIPVDPQLESYTVLAVDGSQIYPDRHQGTSCFLLNTGSVLLRYGQPGTQAVWLDSKPTVFVADDADSGISPEVVNCRRQELELDAGLRISRTAVMQSSSAVPFTFLFDGSLIFWHLESQDPAIKDRFLHTYLQQLEQLYHESILCAGYISLPKSKELVNLIRIELCKFKIEGCKELEAVNHLVDTVIARFFLQPATRSIIFKSNAKIGAHYPEHLAPHFFYMDTGFEMVRVEVPAWIALDEKKLTTAARIILNQTIKGRGYPVALAEAHEQAVVKGPDREFFYHLIAKLGIEQQKRLTSSQKSMKKRGMGV